MPPPVRRTAAGLDDHSPTLAGGRTLDALHLATMPFLMDRGLKPRLASHDRRLTAAAEPLGIDAYRL